MPKFAKAILSVDTYQSGDGEVKVTPERLKHWADTFIRMRSAKIKVPVSWGHSDNAESSVPLDPRNRSRPPQDNVGYLDSFKVSNDGKSAKIVLDIPRGQDASKVEANLAEVSPVIFDSWKDGKGKVHNDCITHIDLVQHPVDNSQTDFVPETIACALRMGLDTGKPITYRLAEHAKDEDNSSFDSSKNSSSDSSDSDPFEDADGEVEDTDRVKKVIAALSALSIILPEDTMAENFFERVEAALLTAAAMGDGGMATGTEGLESTAPEFAAMSLDTPFAKFASNEHRKGVSRRLDTLLEQGRCTPAEHHDKLEAIKTVHLSLDAEGNHHPTRTEAWIESREAVPAGTFWDAHKRTRMSDLEVVPHPEDMDGELTHEQADGIVDGMFAKK